MTDLCRPFDDCCCRPAAASRQGHLHRLRCFESKTAEMNDLGQQRAERRPSNSIPTAPWMQFRPDASCLPMMAPLHERAPGLCPVIPHQHTNAKVVNDLLASGTF